VRTSWKTSLPCRESGRSIYRNWMKVLLSRADRFPAVESGAFAGLSVEDGAALLAISRTSVKRDWSVTRARLLLEIGRAEISREH